MKPHWHDRLERRAAACAFVVVALSVMVPVLAVVLFAFLALISQ